MRTPLVVFSHGKETGPAGRKILALTALAQARGAETASLDYRDLVDPRARAQRLVAWLAQRAAPGPLLLVGSSMGGWVSCVAAQEVPVAGLFLMAPAVGMEGYEPAWPRPRASVTCVVGGWRDELIPPEHLLRFSRDAQADLLMLEADHRLDPRLPDVEWAFQRFLERALRPRT